MYEAVEFKIQGISPLIMHNGQLADPLNPFSKQLKEITGKRKKTDADHEAMSKIEWFGGLYVNDDKRPVVPGTNIEAMLIEAGKKVRMGDAFKAGVICDGDWPVDYDGPKAAEELWNKAGGKFTDRRGCVVGQSRVMRTRPIFRKWGLAFTINFLPDLLNLKDVRQAVTTAGRIIGLCDYTPKFGRFELAN